MVFLELTQKEHDEIEQQDQLQSFDVRECLPRQRDQREPKPQVVAVSTDKVHQVCSFDERSQQNLHNRRYPSPVEVHFRRATPLW